MSSSASTYKPTSDIWSIGSSGILLHQAKDWSLRHSIFCDTSTLTCELLLVRREEVFPVVAVPVKFKL